METKNGDINKTISKILDWNDDFKNKKNVKQLCRRTN